MDYLRTMVCCEPASGAAGEERQIGGEGVLRTLSSAGLVRVVDKD